VAKIDSQLCAVLWQSVEPDVLEMLLFLKKWNLQQFDVKNVFLRGELEEDIYIELTPGYGWKLLPILFAN